MSRTPVERTARQSLIIKVARELFDQKGVENVGMEDIARSCKYTRRTLYAYFQSRDEISVLVMTEDMAIRRQLQFEAMEAFTSGLDKIICWAKTLYNFSIENQASIKLNIYLDYKGIDPAKLSPKTFESFEMINSQLAEDLRDIFKLGVEDQSLRSDLKVDLTISQFLYSIRMTIYRSLSDKYSFAQFDGNEYFNHYLDNFILTIKNEKK